MFSKQHLELSRQQSNSIYYAVEESIYWLENAVSSSSIRPVGYSARIAWEMLYKAKEELDQVLQMRNTSLDLTRKRERIVLLYSVDYLDNLFVSIEQVMKDILNIEVNSNLLIAQASAERCRDRLNLCLGAGSSGAMSPSKEKAYCRAHTDLRQPHELGRKAKAL